MSIVYIGLGSNIGNRKQNIAKACLKIAKIPKTSILRNSPLYDTTPVGPAQRNFINGVLKIRTFLSPVELLNELKTIEQDMGRKNSKRWGPRLIDLDILLYGKKKYRKAGLTIPHPEAANRLFVLEPLSKVVPRKDKRNIEKMKEKLSLTTTGQKVRIIKDSD